MNSAATAFALALTLPTLGLAQGLDPQTAWQQFTQTQGDTWQVAWNNATNTPKAIFGPGLDLPGPVSSLEQARGEAQNLFNRYGDLLGRGRSEFVETIGVKASKVYILVYDQKFQGLDVINGRADVRIHEVGRVAMFGSSAVQIPAGFNLVPVIPAAAAHGIAANNVLGGAAKAPVTSRLVIWASMATEGQTTPHLAWEVQLDERSAGTGEVGKAYVSAANGAYLHFENEVYTCGCGSVHTYKSTPKSSGHAARMERSARLAAKLADLRTPAVELDAPMALTGTVMAWTNTGHLPISPLTNEPMANLQVTSSAGTAFTDANGNFSIPYTGTAPVTVTATLTGRHSRRIRVAQGSQLQASASVTPGTAATIQIGSQNMGEFDRAQTTTYYFTDDVNEWMRGLLPGASAQIGLMSNVNPRVNIASSCNAFYTNYTINFYNTQGQCNMTAFETVVQHEWGHGIDQAFGGISQTDGLSEGWGDILGLFRSGQPELGPGFFVGSTTGIRRGTNTRTYPAGGGVHQQGETWMGFAWDLRGNLIRSLGNAAGIAKAEEIVVASIAADATNQPDAVREVFILDDDDGNLNNGTPNYLDLEAAAVKRALPYPQRQNPNAGSFVTYGAGCAGSGQLPSTCVTANVNGATRNGTTRTGVTYAVSATAPASLQVNGFELWTQVAAPQTLTTRIYDADANGRPGTILGTSTITVGTTRNWYQTRFARPISIAAGQRFFVSYSNNGSTTNLATSSRLGTNITYFRNDAGGGAWTNPLTTVPWAYRVNCVGGPGAVPEITFNGLPEIAQPFTLGMVRGNPNSTGLLIVGASDSTWNGTPLPLPLDVLGAPGCRLLASLDVVIGMSTNAQGAFSRTFNLPNDPTLFGGTFFNQFAVADSANAFGLVLSNAGSGKIGKQ